MVAAGPVLVAARQLAAAVVAVAVVAAAAVAKAAMKNEPYKTTFQTDAYKMNHKYWIQWPRQNLQ